MHAIQIYGCELRDDTRFVDCEKWRKDFGVDELVRTFDYIEKPKVFEYYPQYYHKTDKVIPRRLLIAGIPN